MDIDNERVRVKIQVGSAQVEVEASLGKIREAVEQVTRALKPVLVPAEALEELVRSRKPELKPQTCRALVQGFYVGGWFLQARSLREVVEELARAGHNYDPSAVSHVLLDMVREGILRRTGSPRRYSYVQAAERVEEARGGVQEGRIEVNQPE